MDVEHEPMDGAGHDPDDTADVGDGAGTDVDGHDDPLPSTSEPAAAAAAAPAAYIAMTFQQQHPALLYLVRREYAGRWPALSRPARHAARGAAPKPPVMTDMMNASVQGRGQGQEGGRGERSSGSGGAPPAACLLPPPRVLNQHY